MEPRYSDKHLLTVSFCFQQELPKNICCEYLFDFFFLSPKVHNPNEIKICVVVTYVSKITLMVFFLIAFV